MKESTSTDWMLPEHHDELRAIDHPILREFRVDLLKVVTSQILLTLANPSETLLEELEKHMDPDSEDFEKLASASFLALCDEIDARILPRAVTPKERP